MTFLFVSYLFCKILWTYLGGILAHMPVRCNGWIWTMFKKNWTMLNHSCFTMKYVNARCHESNCPGDELDRRRRVSNVKNDWSIGFFEMGLMGNDGSYQRTTVWCSSTTTLITHPVASQTLHRERVGLLILRAVAAERVHMKEEFGHGHTKRG